MRTLLLFLSLVLLSPYALAQRPLLAEPEPETVTTAVTAPASDVYGAVVAEASERGHLYGEAPTFFGPPPAEIPLRFGTVDAVASVEPERGRSIIRLEWVGEANEEVRRSAEAFVRAVRVRATLL